MATTAYRVHWFDLFVSKTMSLPPYTTIPLHPLCTVSTGLTFLHQRQCPHHHIPLFHCVLHPLHTASTGLTFWYQRQCPHHHITLFHCVLHTVSTASTVYCVHSVCGPESTFEHHIRWSSGCHSLLPPIQAGIGQHQCRTRNSPTAHITGAVM